MFALRVPLLGIDSLSKLEKTKVCFGRAMAPLFGTPLGNVLEVLEILEATNANVSKQTGSHQCRIPTHAIDGWLEGIWTDLATGKSKHLVLYCIANATLTQKEQNDHNCDQKGNKDD